MATSTLSKSSSPAPRSKKPAPPSAKSRSPKASASPAAKRAKARPVAAKATPRPLKTKAKASADKPKGSKPKAATARPSETRRAAASDVATKVGAGTNGSTHRAADSRPDPAEPPATVELKPAAERVGQVLPRPEPVTSGSKPRKNLAGLSAKDLEHFRHLLLHKRAELLGDMTSLEREALQQADTNLSSLPMHMADQGTDAYEQEFTLGLVEKERLMLREINVALVKVQDGRYGVCEGTAKPISKPRLEAQPWAKYSIEHARQLEKPAYRR